MNMVGHEHVGMHGTMFPHGQFTQSLQVTKVVRFTKEARPAIVAALNHVLGDTGDVQAGMAGDGEAPVTGAST
jgi:hypothetical protein